MKEFLFNNLGYFIGFILFIIEISIWYMIFNPNKKIFKNKKCDDHTKFKEVKKWEEKQIFQ